MIQFVAVEFIVTNKKAHLKRAHHEWQLLLKPTYTEKGNNRWKEQSTGEMEHVDGQVDIEQEHISEEGILNVAPLQCPVE